MNLLVKQLTGKVSEQDGWTVGEWLDFRQQVNDVRFGVVLETFRHGRDIH